MSSEPTAVPRSTPSAEGIDPAGIDHLLTALERLHASDPHGIIVQRHGRRVAEGYWAPHAAGDRPLVYSLSKTFTTTALGVAVGERAIGLGDTVGELFPEQTASSDERTRSIRVRHLASMSSGYENELLPEVAQLLQAEPQDPVAATFVFTPEHEPGSWFTYNQPPFSALAAALQQRTGERLIDYLRPRVLDRIGAGPLSSQQWAPGTDLGFSGIHASLDTIARLAQLLLDDGVVDGERVLPEGWVADASTAHIDNPRQEGVDWRQGYGFGLWRSRHGYRGDGAFGQFLIVLPEHDAVLAMFGETVTMQAVLDAVWKHLLPAFDRAAHPGADDALAARLATLHLPTPRELESGSPLTTDYDQSFTRDGGDGQPRLDAVRVRGDELVLHEDGEDLVLPLTCDGWAVSPDRRFAVSGAAVGDAIAIDVASLETPHRLRLRLLPGAGTFSADWNTPPLGSPREGDTLRTMHAPD